METVKLPILFIGHGSPMNAVQSNSYTQALTVFGEHLLNKVTAVLCVSAHWQTEGVFVTASSTPKIIYDFGGFPKELYEVKYPCMGNPTLAKRVVELLESHGAKLDSERGLDHGVWAVLKFIFPNANIPIVQLSMCFHYKTQEHYDVAKLLQPLREEGVLVVGSGNIVHSFFEYAADVNANPPDWAKEFDNNIASDILNCDHEKLVRYRRIYGKSAKKSVPTDEHYLPLLYTVALQTKEDPVNFIFEGFQYGGFSMRSVCIGKQN